MRKRWFFVQHHRLAHQILTRFPLFLMSIIGYSLIYPFILLQPLVMQICLTPYMCLMACFSRDVSILEQHLIKIQMVVLRQGEALWGVKVYQRLLAWLCEETAAQEKSLPT